MFWNTLFGVLVGISASILWAHFCSTPPEEFSLKVSRSSLGGSVWVSVNGSDFNGNGTMEAPWQTLGRAFFSGASTVNVQPGVYVGQGNIGLTSVPCPSLFRGSGSFETVIDCGGGFFVAFDNCTPERMSNFTLRNCAPSVVSEIPLRINPVVYNAPALVDGVFLDGCRGVFNRGPGPVYSCSLEAGNYMFGVFSRGGSITLRNVASSASVGPLVFMWGYGPVAWFDNVTVISHLGRIAAHASDNSGGFFNFSNCVFMDSALQTFVAECFEYYWWSQVHLLKSRFLNCSCQIGTLQDTFTLFDSVFQESNVSLGRSNAVWGTQNVQFESCIPFDSSSSIINGLAVLVKAANFTNTSGILKDSITNFTCFECHFHSVDLQSGTAIASIYSQTNSARFDNCAFSSVNGTAILVGGGSLTFSGCVFSANSGIAIDAAQIGRLYFFESVFLGNFGPIVRSLGDLVVQNCNFSSNGATAIISNGNSVIISSNFTQNNGGASPGGAVYATGGALNITRCHFIENLACGGGGVAAENCLLTIYDSFFVSNSVFGGGGALLMQSHLAAGTTSLSNTIFFNNSATDGGAIFCNNSVVTSSHVSFTLNSARLGVDVACINCLWAVDLTANISCSSVPHIIRVNVAPNCSDVGVCGLSYSCCTIGRALQIALPGYFILVGHGFYSAERFPLIIDKANVTVVGDDAMLDCRWFTCFAFAELVENITVQGLRVLNGNPSMLMNQTSSPVIRGVTFIGGSFEVQNRASPVFERCHFLDELQGLVNSTNTVLFNDCDWNVSSVNQTAGETVFLGCRFSGANSGAVSISGMQSLARFEGCQFEKNEGRAVELSEFASVMMDNCLFRSNIATDGGAIYGQNAHLNLTGCSFMGNLASAGGAILVDNSTLLAFNCSFISNLARGNRSAYATNSAGAIAAFYNSSVHVEESSLFGNSADLRGGAVFCVSSTMNLEKSVVARGASGYEGGAISASSASVVRLKECKVFANTATYGGAMYSDAGSSISISQSELGENRAPFGAAVYCSPESIFEIVDGTVVRDHIAGFEKAPIVLVNTIAIMRDSSFYGNIGQEGGVFWTLLSSLTFQNCNMSHNSAVNLGGAIFVSGSTVSVIWGNYYENFSVRGGAIYASSVTSAACFLNVKNASFNRNAASDSGAGIYVLNVTSVSVEQCEFIGNKASYSGGGISALQCMNFTVSGSTFESNLADSLGGGLFAQNSSVQISDNSHFFGNEADQGGAVFADLCSLFNIEESSFLANTASSAGGALCLLNTSAVVTSSAFSNCSSIYGGGLFMQDGKLERGENLEFRFNLAGVGGAGLFFERSSCYACIGCSFFGNSANGYGNNNASQPIALRIKLPEGKFPDHTAMFPPGSTVSIGAALVDSFGQNVSDPRYLLSIDCTQLQIQGGVPHNQQPALGQVEFSASFVGGELWIPHNCSISSKNVSSFPFRIRLTSCSFGSTNSTTGCDPCDPKKYSFDSLACYDCPPEAELPCASLLSNAAYNVTPGLWVLPSMDEPLVMVTCPRIWGKNVTNCREMLCRRDCNVTSCKSTCADFDGRHHCEGAYTGSMCTQCRCPVHNTSAPCSFRTFTGECIPCHETTVSTVFFVLGTVVGIGLFICVVVMEQSHPVLLGIELVAAAALILIGVQGQWFVELMFIVLALTIIATTPSVNNGAIKILLFFVQVTNSLVRNRLWPGWFEVVAQKLNIANIQISGLQCLNREVFTNDAAEFALQMMFPLFLIVCVCAIIALRHFMVPLARRLWRKIKKSADNGIEREIKSEDEALLLRDTSDEEIVEEAPLMRIRADHSPGSTKELLIKTVIFVLYVGYFELTNQIFSVFDCVHWEFPSGVVLPDSVKYLQDQIYMDEKPWIMCDLENATYGALLAQALVFGVIFVLGIPAFYTFLLWKYREQIRQEEHIPWLVFLYEDYKPQVFWFELLWMGRRVLLSVFITSIGRTSPFQPFFITLILSLSLALELHLHPFKDKMENALEAMVLITLLVSYSGSYGSQDNNSFIPFQWFIGVLNAVVLVVLVLAVLWPFLLKIYQKMRICCHKNRRSKKPMRELNRVEQ